MRRRSLAVSLLVLLLASAGCVGGSGSVDEAALAKNVTYEWDTGANATITIERTRYEAVYRIENRSEFSTYGFERFNNRRPIVPIGLRFRYPNGTVTTLPGEAVTKGDSKTTIDLPASEGMLAYSVRKNGKRVRIPRVVEGTYVVVLPPGADVKYPLLAHVVPGGFERIASADVVRLRWDSIDRDRIGVRYYLERDALLLGGLLAIAGVAILLGGAHYWFAIRSLRRRREEIDVEHGEGRS